MQASHVQRVTLSSLALHFKPRSRPFNSSTVHAYLNKQKYGLFCSLVSNKKFPRHLHDCSYFFLSVILCSIRMLGSAALNLCSIAEGSADLYYEFGIHVWDIAAAGLIVEEAGGVLLDPSGM